MALFLEGYDLNAKLIKLIREADQFLLIVSPFIKLHQRIRDELYSKRNFPNFKIVVLFGKNPEAMERSLNEIDYNFLSALNNVEIRYSEHLHAKFYCSEDAALITSMNIYKHSHDNNIEAGIMLLSPDANTKSRELGTDVDEHAYRDALAYFHTVIDRSDIIHPEKNTNGFCIRTGIVIPFNSERPMSYEAFKTWASFSNPDYLECFCHKTGKVSNGKTTMRNPILFD